MKSRLDNLFFYFGFWGYIILFGAEGERRGMSIGSWISVLTSSTSNTVNLLTSSDRGALFASHTKQNPPPGLKKPFLPLLLSYDRKYPFNNIISFIFYIITNFSLLNSCCLLL